jgi:hypothetical protein
LTSRFRQPTIDAMPDHEPNLPDLIKAVEKTDDAPLERLAEAVRLSQRLSGLADDLVGHFVEASRRAGHSWSQIGDQLGVTKQAAQQRFPVRPVLKMPRIARRLRGSDKGGSMFDRFTEAGRNVMVLAQDEAQRLNHNYLGTEHILLGVIRDESGAGAKALRAAGISLETIRRKFEELIGKGVRRADGVGAFSASAPIPFTPRAKKVLELSVREALQLGHGFVGSEHLLLGILREGEGVAAQVLLDFGVSRTLRAEILRMRSSEEDIGSS